METEIPYDPQRIYDQCQRKTLPAYREAVRDQCRKLGHSGLMTRDENIMLAGCYARSESVAQGAAKVINERLRTGKL